MLSGARKGEVMGRRDGGRTYRPSPGDSYEEPQKRPVPTQMSAQVVLERDPPCLYRLHAIPSSYDPQFSQRAQVVSE
jgi:hypothetical protein